MSRIYVAVDLETTGLSAESDAILEIGAVKFRLPTQPDEEPMIERWSTLVNPGRPIPYNISLLTGIAQKELDMAPTLDKVLPEFTQFVGNYPIVGHYVIFELSFLQRQGALIGQAHLDTFELASLLLPTAQRYSLGQLATFLDIPFDEWHRALPDAEMSANLLLALWQRAQALPLDTLEAIANVARDSEWDLRSFFVAAHRLAVQVRQANDGAFPAAHDQSNLLTDSLMSQVQLLAPQAPRQAVPNLPAQEEIAAFLAEGGIIKADEERVAQQVAIFNAVTQAFRDESHLMIETGAGSAPLRAYTLAAIYEALRRGESVLMASRSFSIQNQLLMEELPFLRQQLPHPFTIHWLKRSNSYLCPRRVEMLRQRGTFTAIEARVLTRILIWMDYTQSGDRSELNLQEHEEGVWQLLCADEARCSHEACGPYGTCYWLQAQEQAAQAHLLITHHQVLVDYLASESQTGPSYEMLIIDEAHHFEEQATRELGFAVRHNEFYTTLEQLLSWSQRPASGMLATIRRQVGKKSPIAKECEQLGKLVVQSRRYVDELMNALEEALRYQRHQRYRYRILRKWHNLAEWNTLAQVLNQLGACLQQLLAGLASLQQNLAALDDKSLAWQNRIDGLQLCIVSLKTLFRETKRILVAPDANDVCWIQVQEADKNDELQKDEFNLHRAPISLTELLQERLFKAKRSVVLTSSTLGLQSDFSFLRERLGVKECAELSILSPYDYTEQALVYLVDDLPPPNKQHYVNRLQHAIIELAKATEGRILVLFTSVSQLKSTYRAISSTLARDNIVVLGQYMDGPNTQLVERFSKMDRAVLFGTYFFWEAINIAGPALSCVAITRLPFPPNTEPVQAARAASYRDAFGEYRIPQTVMRLRQGFERVIQSHQDRGVIALFDSRLEHKSYGQSILDSLPNCNLQIGSLRHLPPLAERWLKDNQIID